MQIKKTHPRIHLISLGCPKNQVDSELMLGALTQQGFSITDDPAAAQVIVVNTCCFIQPAKEESIRAILEAAACRQSGALQTLVVAGCLPQRYGKSLAAEMPEVDLWIGLGEVPHLARLLARSAGRRPLRARACIGGSVFLPDHATPRHLASSPASAYLKVSEGCDNACAFCVIPSIRGPQKSRPLEDLVREAAGLAGQGVRELNLIAQDLTAWGHDLNPRCSLAELLEALDRVEAIHWLRPLYCYPRAFSPRLLGALARSRSFARYLDLPLQHISAPVLKRMRRGQTPETIRRLLRRLRQDLPGLTLRTAFIVGFPGETDADFRRLCDFVDEQRFEHVGVFCYSDEEGTLAAKLPGKIDPAVALKRRDRLMRLQQSIALEHQRRLVGQQVEVLVEGAHPESDDLLTGRLRGMAPEIDGAVIINEGLAPPGFFARVEITAAAPYDLVGRIVEPLAPVRL